MTETCEDDASHLITHVETTAGPVSDGAATPHIHQALERQGLLLTTHIVDTGYLDAELLVTSQRECHVDLLNNSARSLLALVENRMDALLTIRLMAEWHEVKFSALTVPTADAVPAEV